MRLLIAAPFLLILVVFALSNQQPTQLGFWPTGLTVPVPVSIAILVAMGVAFLVGALMTWVTGLSNARRARRAEETVRLLQEEVRALKQRAGGRISAPALEP